jgi:hypothetical protein
MAAMAGFIIAIGFIMAIGFIPGWNIEDNAICWVNRAFLERWATDIGIGKALPGALWKVSKL